MCGNDLNMVRLAFQRSKISGLHYVYLTLSSLCLAQYAICSIFFNSPVINTIQSTYEHIRLNFNKLVYQLLERYLLDS